MSSTATRTSPSVRARGELDHPVIDADGHFLEFSPLFAEDVSAIVRDLGGPEVHERFLKSRIGPWDSKSRATTDPRDTWRAADPFWGWPAANTLDRATAHLPRLMLERLDEFGIDFAVLYPSHGLSYGHGLAYRYALDPELAQAVSRAMNTVYAEMFRGVAGRVTIAASIPMHTPTAAIEELDYAVQTLGFKTARMNGYAVRPLPRVHRDHPELFLFANHFDTFGLDSEYDYDPFWARCIELGIAPVTHTSLLNRPTRSVSNYVYNHIGGLAHAHEALCKSLFLGGVTRRFPDLNVAFLEAGVGWACVLLADLVGHWEKRNVDALRANLDPARLDIELLVELIDRYGDPGVQERVEVIRAWLAEPEPVPAELDDFVACAIGDVADIIELFVPHFYFGCEGDDPGVSWAFHARTNPEGARLRAMFGSDISHWDVPDMTEPMAEAYEQVEDGRLSRDDFRDFTFANAVRLYTKTNPQFFDGTPCEAAACEYLETADQ